MGVKTGHETTIYGRVMEIAWQLVDSGQFVITAKEDLGNIKALYRVTSDSDGNYEAIADPPKGYSWVGIAVAGVDDPAFNSVYRGYEVYEDREKTNYCCAAGVGKKKRYGFRLYR